MPRFEVLQDYRSGSYGPWEKGAKVELDDEEAAWVNRDTGGGTLKEIPPLGAERSKPEAAPEVEAKAEEAAAGAASTKDEGAPVAINNPRGRGGRSSSTKGRN